MTVLKVIFLVCSRQSFTSREMHTGKEQVRIDSQHLRVNPEISFEQCHCIILNQTRSSAIAGRPCDAIACQGLLKSTWKWQPRLKWPSKYLKVIKSGTNWKLVYDFLLVVYSNFCRITHRFWEIWCETVRWPWNMPKVIDSCITWKPSCVHVCKMFERQWPN